MSYIGNILNKLTRQLLPTGRAYRMPDDGDLTKLMYALDDSNELVVNDIKSIYDTIFPDNNNFDVDDAQNWERALGLISNNNVPISERKKAIFRKMNHPSSVKARQNYRFIEKSLNDAGFPVRVFENRFWNAGLGKYESKPIADIATSSQLRIVNHGGVNHGGANHGATWVYKIANSIYPDVDAVFDVGDTFGHTFIICGNEIGENVFISKDREIEFRKLVLTLKPTHSIAYALITNIEDESFNLHLNEDGFERLNEDGFNRLLENN